MFIWPPNVRTRTPIFTWYRRHIQLIRPCQAPLVAPPWQPILASLLLENKPYPITSYGEPKFCRSSIVLCPSVTMYRSVVGALHYLTWIKLYHACPVERTLLLHNIGHYDISRAP